MRGGCWNEGCPTLGGDHVELNFLFGILGADADACIGKQVHLSELFKHRRLPATRMGSALHGNALPHISLHENRDGLHDY